MNNIKSKIFILFASILTGVLIINSIDLSKVTSRTTSLNSMEYKNAVEERNQLYREIESIKSENIELRYKINSYKEYDSEKNKKIVEDMKNQLRDYGNLTGLFSVKGEGLVIKIQDGDIDKILDTKIEILRKIFHEDDLSLVLNELRYAGAEAVSINDHRVLPSTGVTCFGAVIGFEDESITPAPFYIYVIGDTEEMKTYLLSENSYLQKLILRDLKIEIEEKEEIILPATSQILDAKYMERNDIQ